MGDGDAVKDVHIVSERLEGMHGEEALDEPHH
jgi:hypothetical protein